MSKDAASAVRRSAVSWRFLPALLLSVVLVVGAVAVVRQVAALPPTPARCHPAIPTVTAGAEIPAGAVSVSLCDDPVEPRLAVVAPPDALVEGINEVIAAYHGLSLAPPQICTADLGPRFDLVFSYAGRAPVRLSAEYYGCHTIGERYGAGLVLQTFLHALAEQRTRQQPWQGTVPPPACPVEDYRRSYLVPAPTDLTEGALCVWVVGKGVGSIRTVPLSASEWANLRTDLAETSRPDDSNNAEGGDCDRARYLVATNAYGEQVNIQIYCSGQAWWSPTVRGDDAMRWDPSPSARAIIARLTD